MPISLATNLCEDIANRICDDLVGIQVIDRQHLLDMAAASGTIDEAGVILVAVVAVNWLLPPTVSSELYCHISTPEILGWEMP